jgi:hypothetical protein
MERTSDSVELYDENGRFQGMVLAGFIQLPLNDSIPIYRRILPDDDIEHRKISEREVYTDGENNL